MTSIPSTQNPPSATYAPSQPQIIPQTLPESLPAQNVLQNQLTSGTSLHPNDQTEIKRHRRSKHEQEGRIYQCECGKAYLSQPALNNHKKSKHPELNANGEKRGRGRPRKYLPNMPGDFETNKYESFFNDISRKKEEGKPVVLTEAVDVVFNFLFKGDHAGKLYSHPAKREENVILNNLYTNASVSAKEKSEKTCDDAFYEYLTFVEKEANQTYFVLILKFIILFRECFNNSRSKKADSGLAEGEEASTKVQPETLPELCNEFYTEFMENNEFFGISDEKEKNEIIEIIQHFCIWLFRKEYTKSKLSLAQ